MNLSQHQKGFVLALFATVFATMVIMLGAFTRLVDAGLGCPDWPGCYGHLLWPNQADEIAVANQKYVDAAPVDIAKTWPEMVHRYFAGTLGLLVFALMVMAFKHRSNPNYPWRLPIVLSLLVVWQAIFGMWTVTMKLLPQVVSIHLLGGFTTFALLGLFSLRLSNWRWQSGHTIAQQLINSNKWVLVGLALIVMQIMLGGWVAANYAALVCSGFPDCLNGTYFPEADYKAGFNLFQQLDESSGQTSYEGGILPFDARLAIHIMHRMGAIVVVIYWMVLIYRLFRLNYSPLSHWLKVIAGLLVLQIALGVSNIVLVLPLYIAVAHNLVGALLLASVVILLGHIYFIRKEYQ